MSLHIFILSLLAAVGVAVRPAAAQLMFSDVHAVAPKREAVRPATEKRLVITIRAYLGVANFLAAEDRVNIWLDRKIPGIAPVNIVQNVRVVHAIHSVEEPPGAQMVTLDVSEDEGSKIMNAVGRLFFIRQDMAR